MVITVLSGGVGAARLLRALSDVVDPREITAVVNVGDDLVLNGLTICPDLDTITYTLADLNNDELGWGLAGESWRVMDELEQLGGASWFRLGDRDLATHLYRSQRLSEGATKSQVTAELTAHHELAIRVLPVTDDVVATQFETEVGRLNFQEYFVRHHHDVKVTAIDIVGAREARATDDVLESLVNASRIVIAPSNPLISIDPILRVGGIREVLERRRDDVVAVSPIIDGRALKGPADRLLADMGHDVSCVGVVDFYKGLVGTWIIDQADASQADVIRSRGVKVIVTTTIMADAHERGASGARGHLVNELRIIPLPSVAMVHEGDDLVSMLLDAVNAHGASLAHHDLLIVTSKVVSKSEGQVVPFDGTEENKVTLIEQQSRRTLRRRGPMRITETHHGFVNANAGIDLSNTDDGTAVLLPKDPDRSARRIRAEVQRRSGIDVAVIVTDTFGRVWRQGVTDVAIGLAGLKPILDLRGTSDAMGRVLEVTEVCVADEIAGAANLVLGKAEGTPFAIVRGLDESYFGEGSVKEGIIRIANEDMFR